MSGPCQGVAEMRGYRRPPEHVIRDLTVFQGALQSRARDVELALTEVKSATSKVHTHERTSMLGGLGNAHHLLLMRAPFCKGALLGEAIEQHTTSIRRLHDSHTPELVQAIAHKFINQRPA